MAHRGRKYADDALMLALVCGATVENAAAKAGVSRRTAARRLADPEFQRRLQELGTEMVKRCSSALTAASAEAIKTLLALLGPTTPHAVRLGAARATLEMGIRMREIADMEDRMAALEVQMASEPSR
jgi:hypothetical protein